MKKAIKFLIRFTVNNIEGFSIAVFLGFSISGLTNYALKQSTETASFLGGTVAGLVGFIGTFLVTKYVAQIQNEKDLKNLLELIRYTILKFDYLLNDIEEKVSKGEEIEYFQPLSNEYGDDINKNIIGKIKSKIPNLIYNQNWENYLAQIKDFKDKTYIIDYFMYLKTVSQYETVQIHRYMVCMVSILKEYGINDECFNKYKVKTQSKKMNKIKRLIYNVNKLFKYILILNKLKSKKKKKIIKLNNEIKELEKIKNSLQEDLENIG